MTRLILSLATLVVLSTQTPARPRPAPSNAHGRRASRVGVRRIDFRNFRYRGGGEELRVARGRGVYKEAGDLDFAYTIDRVRVVYGDMTGDGQEEAAVVLYFNGGGTGAFSKGFLFAARRGRLTLLTTFEGGDRADGGIRAASIKGGTLSVQRNEPERVNGVIASGLCCPVYWVTTDYRFDGGRLVTFGEPRKVAADPDAQ